jgi:hypothetical protein
MLKFESSAGHGSTALAEVRARLIWDGSVSAWLGSARCPTLLLFSVFGRFLSSVIFILIHTSNFYHLTSVLCPLYSVLRRLTHEKVILSC